MIFRFGLLQCTDTIFETGRKTAYHFLHLTFQEYLAAMYLVKIDKQLEFFQSVSIHNFEFFSIVLRFCFGIAKLESRHFIDLLATNNMYNERIYPHCTTSFCHFAFEAKSEQITDTVIKYLHKKGESKAHILSNSFYNISFRNIRTAHDCAAMFYIIESIPEKSNILIDACSCGIRGKKIKKLTNILNRKGGMVQVAYLNISHNKLTDECVCDLFSRAGAAVSSSLTVLSLRGNKIGADGCKSITGALKKVQSKELFMLDLSDNPLGSSGLQALETLICNGSLANNKIP